MSNQAVTRIGNYDIILADPPWSYYGDPNKDQGAGKHYGLMSDDTLKNMRIRDMFGGTVLYLWATCPRLDAAVDVMRAWGFHYRGVAFVWVKTTLAGKIISAQGVRPSFIKPTTELVLVGSIKRKGRALPVLDETLGQVVLAPRGRHSEKPEEVRHRIEVLHGAQKRIELFARGRFPNWDAWGDEV